MSIYQSHEPEQYFLKEEVYKGSHPFFYDPINHPDISELEKNWIVIRDEVLQLVTDKELQKIKNLNPPYLSDPDAWKNIYFYNFGWKKHKNCIRFPKTHHLLMKVPNLIFAGITVLEPNSRVLPHNGETNTTMRCHLGLKIPASLPHCGIRVGSEEKSWGNGKVIMFSDAHYHSVWNLTDQKRIVLVFDILRPEFASHRNSVCANVLGALSLKFFYSKLPSTKSLPYPIIRFVHFFFKSFWYLYLPIQQRIRWLP